VHGGRENLEAIDFLRQLNIQLHGEFPRHAHDRRRIDRLGGRLASGLHRRTGLQLKWDMGWMNDTLRYMRRDPIHRSHHQNELSFRMVYAFTENFMLPLSHDEVVHGKRRFSPRCPATTGSSSPT
jgi:1,4-alpha-glucan branching enzyme